MYKPAFYEQSGLERRSRAMLKEFFLSFVGSFAATGVFEWVKWLIERNKKG
jgi:hypothetical protein